MRSLVEYKWRQLLWKKLYFVAFYLDKKTAFMFIEITPPADEIEL